MRYIGIDPGKTGGIAIIDGDYPGSGDVIAEKMPDTVEGILLFLRLHSAGPRNTRGAIEYVRTSPQMGVVSAGSFMRNYGHCEMGLAAAGVPYYDVHPLRWQRALGCLTKGDKNVSKAKAAELWPGLKITHAVADALLIAEWCRRSNLGLLKRGIGEVLREDSASI